MRQFVIFLPTSEEKGALQNLMDTAFVQQPATGNGKFMCGEGGGERWVQGVWAETSTPPDPRGAPR